VQLCARLAYLNKCDGGPDAGPLGCFHNHDMKAVLAAKPAPVAEPCPVFKAWGVCPAGLNCRFEGHIINGKNVDRDGVEITPESDWAKKLVGVSHPLGETNFVDDEMKAELRKRKYDFSRSAELVKIWNARAQDQAAPIGPIDQPERKPLNLFGKTVLAPLTTVGNLPFRRLCVGLGCEVTVGEMALAQSILEGQKQELALLRRHESEKCFGVQIAGGDVQMMTKVAQFADEHVDCDFLDINCGCPLEDVHKRGAGSQLMSRKTALQGIVRCMSSVLKTKALTLKMRTAHYEDKKYHETAGRYAHTLVPQLEEWGVSALFLHGRTARQRYTNLADWDYASQCGAQRTRRTPFIVCGDVMSWEEAEEHTKDSNIDGIMIGRGALIKPWIFTEISERRHWDISASERFDLMRNFVSNGLEHWGADARGVETTRRFLLEWLSFTCRYIPVGLLEVLPQRINWRPAPYIGRNDLETKLASQNAQDWVEITEMLLGKVPQGFSFMPKHKSNSYNAVETPIEG